MIMKRKPLSRPDDVGVAVASSSITSNLKYKCSWNECEKSFNHRGLFRAHYRTHTKLRPYKCTFPSCDYASSISSNLKTHIRNDHHLKSKRKVKKYVEVQREVLDEEAKQLGIRKIFTEELNGEVMSEDAIEATASMPTLPDFTTIIQTSTGNYFCPFSECVYQAKSIHSLKVHYRVHCGNDYRPFRCIFPDDSCEYAANIKEDVKKHIRVKHFHLPVSIKEWNETYKDDDRNESDFIETRTDRLEMEDALFSNAVIISPPEVQIHRPFACTLANCSKKFTILTNLRDHLRTHTKLKPFKCSFPKCDRTSTKKENLLKHIQSRHFKIKVKDQKNLSNEEKQKAEQYVEVDQDELDEEETKIATIRIGPKSTHRKRNRQSTNPVDDYKSLPSSPI